MKKSNALRQNFFCVRQVRKSIAGGYDIVSYLKSPPSTMHPSGEWVSSLENAKIYNSPGFCFNAAKKCITKNTGFSIEAIEVSITIKETGRKITSKDNKAVGSDKASITDYSNYILVNY